MKNKLLISVAGSGKTTYLVRQALSVNDSVLITTYTEANEKEIRKKFYEFNGGIPANITIQTWFSFLLQHGAKPYQGSIYDGKINGLLLVNTASGINFKNKMGISIPFAEEKNFEEHYFSKSGKVYSDKLSKFVIRCNEKSAGIVVQRLSKIYKHFFVDEVQDLAGNDLEFLKLIFKTSMNTILVGDPRQVTYLTHHERLNSKYKDGNIKQYIIDKCSKYCAIDEETLRFSHRNNAEICNFSSKLFPYLEKSIPCECSECRSFPNDHSGIYIIKSSDVEKYKSKYNPVILRHQLAVAPEWNFGNCKGLGFDRILIYPTRPIIQYLKTGLLTKTVKEKGKIKEQNALDTAKFYVALTRARYSVAIVFDYTNDIFIDGINKYTIN
ncbi:UvrD-helicase domain-containing protein [Chryseobacterium formosense]|uniref:UvrD-helicase domain-containing protein n=1 Tax=Chryseobacterium formosense TaxID=236814 RepID=UPI001E4154C6|nr:UvrD-helicase domain-containing protein [Chryseobacterium formosense]